MSDYSWTAFYRAALLETDKSRLPGCIALAKQEMVKRLKSLTTSAEDEAELLEIDEGLRNLAVLERKKTA